MATVVAHSLSDLRALPWIEELIVIPKAEKARRAFQKKLTDAQSSTDTSQPYTDVFYVMELDEQTIIFHCDQGRMMWDRGKIFPISVEGETIHYISGDCTLPDWRKAIVIWVGKWGRRTKDLICCYDKSTRKFVPIVNNMDKAIYEVWKVFDVQDRKISCMNRVYSELWPDGKYHPAKIDEKDIDELRTIWPLTIVMLREEWQRTTRNQWGNISPRRRKYDNRSYHIASTSWIDPFMVGWNPVTNIGRSEYAHMKADNTKKILITRLEVDNVWWWYIYNDWIKYIPEDDIKFLYYPALHKNKIEADERR